MTNCSNTTLIEIIKSQYNDGVNWDESIVCQELPLSIILILFLLCAWTFFFIVIFIRGLKHYCSSTKGLKVAKKMQQFQMWFYSLFYTLVSVTTLFSVISFLLDSYYASATVLLVFLFISHSVASTVDVVGSLKKKPGVNDIDFSIALQNLSTLYLPRAVWKMSGHNEFEVNPGKSSSLSNLITKLLCLQDMSNHITPDVYDIKDIVTLQGCFLGLPAIFLYLLSFIRSFDDVYYNSTTDLIDEVADKVYNFNVMIGTAAVFAFISTMTPPLLGDWESVVRDGKTKPKKAVLIISFLIVKRFLEFGGTIGMYVYLVDLSNFAGFILLGLEIIAMYVTYIGKYESPTIGRTASLGHYILSSIEAVFFGFYRRIAVDKDLVTQNNMMSPTIELVRYIMKALFIFIGYIWILATKVPDIYVDASTLKDTVADASNELLASLFFIGVACNVLLIPILIVEFVIFRRSSLDKKELQVLVKYWRKLCTCYHGKVYVNRDRNGAVRQPIIQEGNNQFFN